MSVQQHPAVSAARQATRQRAHGSRPVTLQIGGESVAISGLPGELRKRFIAMMSPFEAAIDPSAATHHLSIQRRGSDMAIVRGEETLAAYGDAHLLLTQLEWHTVTTALESTERYVALHGAALTRDSATVLLLAESGGGKTTLTLGLMGRGWQPLADDIVLIDLQTLAIQPFPRCFHVDDQTRSLVVNEDLIEWPGSIPTYARPRQWAAAQHHVRTILLVERCPTCPSRLQGLTLAEAAATMGNNTIRGRLPRAQVAQVAVRLAAGAASGGRLSNGRTIEDALDLIESVSQK